MATKTNFLDTSNIQADFDISFDDNFNMLGKFDLSLEDVICLAGGVPLEGLNSVKIVIDTLPDDVINFWQLCSQDTS